MKTRKLMKVGALSLTLIAAPAMLSAQDARPPETLVTPNIPMPPAPMNPSLPTVEVSAQPARPDMSPEHIGSLIASPQAVQNAYPPCTVTLQDQCTNTRPEADAKAVRPNKTPVHRYRLDR